MAILALFGARGGEGRRAAGEETGEAGSMAGSQYDGRVARRGGVEGFGR